MLSEIHLNKAEVIEFIDLFKVNTTKLEQPMFGFLCEGAMSPEEAKKQTEAKTEWDGIYICAKRPNEDYWDSVSICKDDDGDYLISTDDMSPLPDVYAYSVGEALKEAQDLLIQYIAA